jgi:hypothetical protein
MLGLEEDGDGIRCPPTRTLDQSEVMPRRWWVTREADCDRATLPKASDAPANDDAPDIAQPIYLALYELRIGEGDTWRDIGFDLDGRCSNDGLDGKSCSNPESIGAEEGNGCRDNAIGKLLAYAKGVVPDLTESNINCELKLGGYNILLRVSDYNGLSDDPQVRIDVYASLGWRNRIVTCEDGVPNYTQILNKLPDHSPDWLIMPESQAPPGSACRQDPQYQGDLAGGKLCATNAYVRGGYLVANVEQAEFWLNGQLAHYPGFRTPLERATLVGWLRYVAGKQRWQFDATLGGATTIEGMLEGFKALGVCKTTCDSREVNEQMQLGGHEAIADALVEAEDVMLSTETLGECDGLSIGWQFAAAQTTGGFAPAPPYAEVTPNSWALSPQLCGDFPNPVAVCAAEPGSPEPVSSQ